MLRNILIAGIVSLSLTSISSHDFDIEQFKSQIPDGIVPEGYNISSLPTPEDAKKLFKEKCYRATKSDEAFLKAENASEVFRECLTGLVDFENLQQEIDAARAHPNGDLDLVFNRYCRKRTIAIECLKDFTVAIEPCLNENEVRGKTIFVKIFTKLLKFVCHKDGDHIALFIAEKGPECFDSKKDALMQCVNTTLPGYVGTETPTLDNLPQLVMDDKQCSDIKSLEQCVVKELESCDDFTPANLVESMFRFVRSETPCANTTASPSDAITSLSFLSTAVLALVARTIL